MKEETLSRISRKPVKQKAACKSTGLKQSRERNAELINIVMSLSKVTVNGKKEPIKKQLVTVLINSTDRLQQPNVHTLLAIADTNTCLLYTSPSPRDS